MMIIVINENDDDDDQHSIQYNTIIIESEKPQKNGDIWSHRLYGDQLHLAYMQNKNGNKIILFICE